MEEQSIKQKKSPLSQEQNSLKTNLQLKDKFKSYENDKNVELLEQIQSQKLQANPNNSEFDQMLKANNYESNASS